MRALFRGMGPTFNLIYVIVLILIHFVCERGTRAIVAKQ